MGGAFLLLHYWMTQDDSGSIPAASFPCYSAAVLKLTLPYAQVSRVTDPTATVRIVLAPYADVRTR